jgi:hypothetical protein
MSKIAVLFLGLAFVLLPIFGQEPREKSEAYSAVALGTGGTVGGKAKSFDFRVSRFTSDEEIQELADLLRQKGPDALRRNMEKLDVGRISPVGSVGNQIAVARKKQVGPDTVITTVTARIMPFVELYRGGRTTDYPFGFLQVRLNDKGEGNGQIMAAAKIRFDKKKAVTKSKAMGTSTSKRSMCGQGNSRRNQTDCESGSKITQSQRTVPVRGRVSDQRFPVGHAPSNLLSVSKVG